MGRATPDLLSKVLVDAHGAREPLSKVGQVTIKDSQTLVVNVFDPDLVSAVCDAIQKANIQLHPQVMGGTVKVAIPRITQDYRDMLSKR